MIEGDADELKAKVVLALDGIKDKDGAIQWGIDEYANYMAISSDGMVRTLGRLKKCCPELSKMCDVLIEHIQENYAPAKTALMCFVKIRDENRLKEA